MKKQFRNILTLLLATNIGFAHSMVYASEVNSCESVFVSIADSPAKDFNKYKLANPFYTLKRTWTNPDKRFFAFVESPIIGLFTQIPSALIANKISGRPWITPDFISNVRESYLGYQSANIFRTSVSLEKSISDKFSLFLNWYYSTAFYTAVTAGPLLSRASTGPEHVYAWSMVLYSSIWPLLSQSMQRKIFIPILFSKFPRLNTLNQIWENKIPTDQMIELEQNRAKNFSAEIDHLNVIRNLKSKSLTDYQIALGIILDKLDDSKTKELIRSQLEETYRDDLDFVKFLDDKEAGYQIRIKELEEEISYAQYNIKWIKYLRGNVEPNQKISKLTKAKYWLIKLAANGAVATTSIVTYFLLRWLMVGHGADHPGMIEDLAKQFYSTFNDVPTPNEVINQTAAMATQLLQNSGK